MPLPQRPIKGLRDPNQETRDRETLNKILSHQFDDSRVRTKAEVLAGITPVNYAYPPGDVRRYGQTEDGDLATNRTAAENALAANSDVYMRKGTYGHFTVTQDDRSIWFDPGVTIKLPDNTVTAGMTSGPPVFGVDGDRVHLFGAFTVDGNRANNNSSSFVPGTRYGSFHVKGADCKLQGGKIIIRNPYWMGFILEDGDSSGDEVYRFTADTIRIEDPTNYAVMIWTARSGDIKRIEGSGCNLPTAQGRIRIGTQTSSSGIAGNFHIGHIQTDGAVITESNTQELDIDSVQCGAGKIEDSFGVRIGSWQADGLLIEPGDENGNSFAMLDSENCHVGVVSVTGHQQPNSTAVAFTGSFSGNINCSVGCLVVTDTLEDVDDCLFGHNEGVVIDSMILRSPGGIARGFFYDHFASNRDNHIGYLFSEGHAEEDIYIESSVNSLPVLSIGYTNPSATYVVGSLHRTDTFRWSSGNATKTLVNPHIGPRSRILLFADNAAAATALGVGIWVDPADQVAGQTVFRTANGANIGGTSDFRYEIFNGI